MSILITTRNLFDIDKDLYRASTKISNNEFSTSRSDYINGSAILRNLIIGKKYTVSYATVKKESISNAMLLWALMSEKQGLYPDEKLSYATGSNKTNYTVIHTFIATKSELYWCFGVGNGIVYNFQLELGDTPTPYVPHLLEVDRIVQTTRNLFDPDKDLYNNSAKINKNTFRIVGGLHSSACLRNLKTGQEYTISYNANVESPIGGNTLAYALMSNKTDNYPSNFILRGLGTGQTIFNVKVTFVASKDELYWNFGVATGIISNFQLEEGTEATPYVPHFKEFTRIAQRTENGVNTLFQA